MLSEQAAKQWTGTFNPRPLTKEDIASIYQNAF
jgi:alcohol dehydrogenase class IV